MPKKKITKKAESCVIIRFELKNTEEPSDFLKKLDKFTKSNKVKYTTLGRAVRGKKAVVPTPNKELEILMNLLEKSDLEIPDYAPSDCTQTMIAEKTCLDTSVVSRYLKSLRERKLVSQQTMNIIGDARRRRCYFLTNKGKNMLSQMFQ